MHILQMQQINSYIEVSNYNYWNT